MSKSLKLFIIVCGSIALIVTLLGIQCNQPIEITDKDPVKVLINYNNSRGIEIYDKGMTEENFHGVINRKMTIEIINTSINKEYFQVICSDLNSEEDLVEDTLTVGPQSSEDVTLIQVNPKSKDVDCFVINIVEK